MKKILFLLILLGKIVTIQAQEEHSGLSKKSAR